MTLGDKDQSLDYAANSERFAEFTYSTVVVALNHNRIWGICARIE